MDDDEFRRLDEGANGSKIGPAVHCCLSVNFTTKTAVLCRGEIENDVSSPVVVKTRMTGTILP